VKTGIHNAVIAARLTDHETFGTDVSYNIDYGATVSDKVRFTIGLGKGFRAPDATDRFGFGGNTELQPETADNFEFGAYINPTSDHGIGVNVFKNDITNLIQFQGPFFGGQNQNVGRSSITGIELSYRYQRQNFRALVEAIVQDPKDLDDDKQLARRAKRGLTANVVYTWDHRHDFGAEFIAQSERQDFDFYDGSDVTLGGYGIVNVSYKTQFQRHWHVGLKLENAFDKDYQLAHGYNAQGRLLLLDITYSSN
jgi:vitamin B12 transporter